MDHDYSVALLGIMGQILLFGSLIGYHLGRIASALEKRSKEE